MKKTLLALTAALLLALPAACMHHAHRGGPGAGCPKHQGCDCKCRQKADCPKTADCPKDADCPQTADCPKGADGQKKPDCPQHRQQEPAQPAR